jgi:hypothetical protein
MVRLLNSRSHSIWFTTFYKPMKIIEYFSTLNGHHDTQRKGGQNKPTHELKSFQGWQAPQENLSLEQLICFLGLARLRNIDALCLLGENRGYL